MQANFIFCRVMLFTFYLQIIKDVVHAYSSINYNSSSVFSITYYNCS